MSDESLPETRKTKLRNSVEHTRAWTGLWVVVAGDAVIGAAAIVGAYTISSETIQVSILTSAFTAIGTMTTAYFGIRAVSNTAQASIHEAET